MQNSASRVLWVAAGALRQGAPGAAARAAGALGTGASAATALATPPGWAAAAALGCGPGGAGAGGAALLLQARSKWWWSRPPGGSAGAGDAAAAAGAGGPEVLLGSDSDAFEGDSSIGGGGSAAAEAGAGLAAGGAADAASAAGAGASAAAGALDSLPAGDVLSAAAAVVEATGAAEAAALAASKAEVWAGTRVFIDLLDWSHADLGMPWWEAIFVANLAIRLATFPITILTQKKSGRMTELRAHTQRMQTLYKEAASAATLPEYQQKQAQIAEAQALLSSKFGPDAKWALLMPVLALANMGVFISQFSAVSTVAGEGLPSMSHGGLAWFPDLTLPDPYYGLPVLCAALTLAMVESGALSAEMGQAQTARTLKWVMRAFALIFVPAGGYVPAAVGVLWFSNSLFSLAQAGILRSPGLRRALGMPSLEAVRAAAAAASQGPPSPLTARLQQFMGSGDGASGSGGAGAGSGGVPGGVAAGTATSSSSSGSGAAAPPPPGTRPSRLAVVEYVLLLTARPDASPEEERGALDAAWSLQFMAPAIMCATVGAVASQSSYKEGGGGGDRGGGSHASEAASGDDRGGFTHFVHFRLANRAALDALRRNPLHAALLRDALAPLSTAPPSLLAFEARLPRELEGLFRRGDEFGEGTELLLLLGPSTDAGTTGGGATGGAEDFLSRLAAFAESSAAGALQASAGAVVAAGSGGGAGDGGSAWPGPVPPTHALMARFPGPRQAGVFLASPPCAAAAAGDPRLPLRALAAVSARVEAGEEGASRRQAL
ncbi:hypothetical protein Rsub_11692 [Raphidocelis subcapitata]|uniref:Stress-response A/B barrel domain-containing protein n=1 Tax=Raphidocelis subcapitata TaxID=307507 RepID=A0A2V0PHI7_9CHLO|nr:hypothetical protein Rsub_11692 [Raphidocelis subcapitata]|eukprot:GBF98482.1 hypothetical protein Rsub_11692 [Raphidocelis subcapitata]